MGLFLMYQKGILTRQVMRVFIVTLLCFATYLLRAQTLSAGFDRDTIQMGETSTLQISVTGGNVTSEPTVPSLPNLRIERTGISRQIISVGNTQMSTVTYIYRVVPLQPAVYSLPPIILMVGGNPLPTQPLTLTVQGSNAFGVPPPKPQPAQPPVPQPAPTPQPPPQPAQPEAAFIRLSIPRNELYIGEVFPVEIALYFMSGGNVQLPNLRCDGFTVNQMIAQQTTEVVNNIRYIKYIFRTIAIPVKTGDLNFGPAECNVTIHYRKDAFSNLELRQVSPTTEAKLIKVSALPTNGVPAGFRGAVGVFNMVASAGPTNLAAGDPITLRVQISGRGALDNVLPPGVDQWREFKAYPATSKLEAPDVLSMAGIKTFEQVIVPQNADIKEIPPINFSFFDPEQKNYRTLTHPAIPLTVRPHGHAPQQPTVISNVAAQKIAPQQTDVVHIKTYSGSLGTVSTPLVQRAWFLLLQCIPIGAWIALYVRRRRIESLANNPRLRRHLEVIALIAKGLADIRQMARENEAEKFYATAFRLLQEQLGERLDMPASAITEAIIDERLRPLDVPDEILAAVHEAFQICNQARYARERTPQELALLADQFEKVLQQLKELELPEMIPVRA